VPAVYEEYLMKIDAGIGWEKEKARSYLDERRYDDMDKIKAGKAYLKRIGEE